MSNIIKADDKGKFLSITSFGFSEIPTIKSGSCCNLLGDADCQEDCTANQDCELDVETTIRNRMEEAERRAKELEREAYETAYAQGRKDGYEYEQKHMSVVKEQLENLLDGLEQLPARLMSDYRDWLIDTSLAISRQVIRRELEANTEQLVQFIDTLLKETSDRYAVTVHLNPKDLAIIEKHVGPAQMSAHNTRKLMLKADSAIERGGCKLESDVELLDATVEKQLALIEQALRSNGHESLEPVS